MFGTANFRSMGNAVRMAQSNFGPVPGAGPTTVQPSPSAMPAPAPTPTAVPAPTPVPEAGVSHGTQVLIAGGVVLATLLGSIFLTD